MENEFLPLRSVRLSRARAGCIPRRSMAAWLAFGAGIAQADLYDDYINSVSKKPFVAFLGREASVANKSIGHAFVGTGVELEAGYLLYLRFFGLYPQDGALAAVKSVFSAQSGKLDRTWSDLDWSTELRHFIDDKRASEIDARFQAWSSNAPAYSLLASEGMNCSVLAGEVAKIAGLKVPRGAGSTRPWKYIQALKEMNR